MTWTSEMGIASGVFTTDQIPATTTKTVARDQEDSPADQSMSALT